MDGKEIAELYINDKISSVITPVKQLKRFKKIFIKSGEEVTVTFKMNAEELGFISPDGKLTTEAGEFEIFVGGNLSDFQKETINVI